ncbi:DUF1553 domain-containing protein [Telmatocola sphagniphila]|nr:DUF1553 domain-containing protein [Telmatocola sphagniphila]
MRLLSFFLFLPGLCAADEPKAFDSSIAPILASRCLDCHSGPEAKAKLDLSTKKGFLQGGDNGPAVVASKPSESLLWQKIEADEMPPKHPLAAEEKRLLKQWIERGSPWGTETIDAYAYSTSSRAGYDWWSFQPIVRPTVPAKNLHPIDAFIQAKLAEKKLKPSPPVDRRTLIRRVTFDLIGLPPTPEEIQNFLQDKSPEAYTQLVDRLLASPRYGERWARHWLDVAHFGESDGFEYDRMRPNAWRYRDWVIQALNEDLPYDQFAKLQIAGDVIQPQNAAAVVATGFLVGGAHDSLLPAGETMQQIMRQDELEDLVGIVGQSFLGLTVNCARCHDHKFDPIRQADYYRLAAALAGVRRGERNLPQAIPSDLVKQIETLKNDIRKLDAIAREQVQKNRTARKVGIAKPPKAIASWDFSKGPEELISGTPSKLHGSARIENNALRLDGKSYLVSAPLPVSLKAKTLEAWVKLDNLEQRGGGIIGIQATDGGSFDCLVFGETEPGRWIAGSEFYRRTHSLQGSHEGEAQKEFVHVALTYGADGTITAYRQGVAYGKSYRVENPLSFSKEGNFQIVLGLRHAPAQAGKLLFGSIARANIYDRALSPEEIAASAGSTDFLSEKELLENLSPEQRLKRTQWQTALRDAEARLENLKNQKTFGILPQSPPLTYRLKRGNPKEKAELISAGGLSLLPENDLHLKPDAPEATRRSKLADWIASEKNPLFARTLVNRVWLYHFGRGLIDTPNDLGFSGGEPSHRELLDWLASEFMAKKWSLKELHRLILNSETYKQDSSSRAEALKLDADNRLLWRYAPHRLEAEALRDAILSIAGKLNLEMGGESYKDVRPYFAKGSWFYEPIDPVGEEFNRRSIYRMTARGGRNPLLDTFDCPDPSTTTPKRGSTTTPLQALSLMNNSFTIRMSEQFAERLEKQANKAPDERIRLGFQLAYGRLPKEAELTASREVIAQYGLTPFCRALLNSNGFLYVH